MADKKKQHYVPKFYLRNFADFSRKSINLFNIPSNKFVSQGALKNQAYSDYFYGKDAVVENALQDIETAVSSIIKNCIENRKIPPYGSEEHIILLTFIVFQFSRTRYSGEMINEILNSLTKKIFSHDPRVKGDLDKVSVGFENPATYALGIAAGNIPLMLDMKYKLIVNTTQIPIITSDNPVVAYNQFLEGRKVPGGITGLATKGLQMFLPLSRDILLVFYDDTVYRVGNRKDSVVTVNNKLDIDYLNLL